jgi:hypothetical protein
MNDLLDKRIVSQNMAKRLTNNGQEPFRAALDVGNGEASGISNETREPIGFEPIIALEKSQERPNYSLSKDNEMLVFGIDDVFEHGHRESARRQSGMDRYTESDYFNLIDVLLLNVFSAQRGKPDRISPTLAINLPVEHFNNAVTVEEIRDTLSGSRDISDYDGCTLRMNINSSKLVVMPESTGALMHWAFDQNTLEKRNSTGGSTLVIDIGYETTDTSLFEGMRYQRDRAFTIRRAGMGNIVRSVQGYALNTLRDVDESRVDRALRIIPQRSIKPGQEKWIEPTPGKEVEVSEIYDSAVSTEAQRIATRVKSLYTEDVTRVLLTGGGAYHLKRALIDQLSFPVEVSPQPEYANVIGALTTLKVRDSRKG